MRKLKDGQEQLFSKSKSHNYTETFMVRTASIKKKMILQAGNLYAAYKKEKSNKGAGGVDGIVMPCFVECFFSY